MPMSSRIHPVWLFPNHWMIKDKRKVLKSYNTVDAAMRKLSLVLIVNPFIDAIQHNIPRLQSSFIWSNVRNDDVYGAPYSCFPNVTEFKFIRTPLPMKTNKISWLDAMTRNSKWNWSSGIFWYYINRLWWIRITINVVFIHIIICSVGDVCGWGMTTLFCYLW